MADCSTQVSGVKQIFKNILLLDWKEIDKFQITALILLDKISSHYLEQFIELRQQAKKLKLKTIDKDLKKNPNNQQPILLYREDIQ